MTYYYQLVITSRAFGEVVLCNQPQSKDWGPIWYRRKLFLYEEHKKVPLVFTMLKVTPCEDFIKFETLAREDNTMISLGE